MKTILLAALLIPAVSRAERVQTPRGLDIVAVTPPHMVDRSITVSEGLQPIEPLELVMFDLDSTALDPMALSELDALAAWLKRYPEQHIVLEGRTDSAGSAAYNLDLGRRRAVAVRSHLRSWGISSDRVVVAVFGARGAHRIEQASDRRVVIYASDRPVRELVTAVLDHTRAESVVWTDAGTSVVEARLLPLRGYPRSGSNG